MTFQAIVLILIIATVVSLVGWKFALHKRRTSVGGVESAAASPVIAAASEIASGPASTLAEPSPPEIFISYAREDRELATLIHDLIYRLGGSPWMDTSNLRIGDDFPDEIEQVIARSAHVLVIASPASMNPSSWVHREVALAHRHGRPMLPLLKESCELPAQLANVNGLDLSGAANSEGRAFIDLMTHLHVLSTDLNPTATHDLAAATHRLTSGLPPLQEMWADFRQVGDFKIADIQILQTASIPSTVVDLFLLWCYRLSPTSDVTRNVASTATDLLDSFSAGKYMLEEFGMDETVPLFDRHVVATNLSRVKNETSICFAHSWIVKHARKNDAVYNTFMAKHAAYVMNNLKDEAVNYMLNPDRGPGNYVVQNLVLALDADPECVSIARRVREWIQQGHFDRYYSGQDVTSCFMIALAGKNLENSKLAGELIEALRLRVGGHFIYQLEDPVTPEKGLDMWCRALFLIERMVTSGLAFSHRQGGLRIEKWLDVLESYATTSLRAEEAAAAALACRALYELGPGELPITEVHGIALQVLRVGIPDTDPRQQRQQYQSLIERCTPCQSVWRGS